MKNIILTLRHSIFEKKSKTKPKQGRAMFYKVPAFNMATLKLGPLFDHH